MTNQWVIPDIHGCSKTLKKLIEEKIQPQKEDKLYFLGDYIDRGSDSKGVIDYLMSLKNNGYNLKCLMGNHEEYLIKALNHEKSYERIVNLSLNRYKHEWFEYGGKECLKSFGVKYLKSIPSLYIDWIKELMLYIVLTDYVLVHAGLDFQNKDPLEDKSHMLWARDFEIIPDKINDRILIHGHIPVHIDFIELSIKKENSLFIDLDNGVYMTKREGFGKLTAYELNSKQLLTQDNIDL